MVQTLRLNCWHSKKLKTLLVSADTDKGHPSRFSRVTTTNDSKTPKHTSVHFPAGSGQTSDIVPWTQHVNTTRLPINPPSLPHPPLLPAPPPTPSLPVSALLSCSLGSGGNRNRKTWSSGRSLCQCGTLAKEGECPAAKAPWCEKLMRDSVNFASSDDDDTSSIPAASLPSLWSPSLPTAPSLAAAACAAATGQVVVSQRPQRQRKQQTAALRQSLASYCTS